MARSSGHNPDLEGQSRYQRRFFIVEHLIQAAKKGNIDLVEVILNKDGSLINQQDKETGETALIAAAEAGHKDVIDFLLEHNANPNICRGTGESAVKLAAMKGRRDIVREFIASGADISDAFIEAAKKGDIGSVAFMLSKSAIDEKEVINKQDKQTGETALIAATNAGHENVVDFLLTHNANPNICRHTGESALMLAAANGRADIAQLLLKSNAYIALKNARGEAALFIATHAGHKSVVELLLASNANPNLRRTTEGEGSALMLAAAKGRKDIAQILLESKADIDLTNAPGGTALFAAISYGQTEMIDFLLDNGAKKQVSDREMTTLHTVLCSQIRGNASIDIIKKLIARDELTRSEKKLEKKDSSAAESTSFVNRGARVYFEEWNWQTDRTPPPLGKTALHLAIDREDVRAVEVLIEAKADVNQPVINGATPYYATLVIQNELLAKKGSTSDITAIQLYLILAGAKQAEASEMYERDRRYGYPRRHF